MLSLRPSLTRRLWPVLQFATSQHKEPFVVQSTPSAPAATSPNQFPRPLPTATSSTRTALWHLQQHGSAYSTMVLKSSKIPPLSSIENAKIKDKSGTEMEAKALWESGPVFIYCIRRPGCVLCRDEAQKIWAERAALEAVGLKVVCVVHEWIDREINAFVPDFWAGEIYHDVDKTFYKVFGDGVVRTGSNWSLLNPFSPVWGRIMAARKNVKESNVTGEASILGGLIVVKAGKGGIAYMHPEVTFGEFPPTQEVIDAAKKALGKA